MPTLPLPNLDDRRWEDLVDEGRSLIPFYAPEWTDHNVHDPGISLLELFAWVTEQDLYTVNRVTDAHRRKLLALAGGVAPDPPRPAGTMLGFGLAPGAPARQLPAGLQVEGRDPFGVVVSFRTLHALTVQPGRIAVVLAAHQAALEDLTPAWRRGEPVQPFGADPRPGDAFHLGFELQAPWPAGTVLALGFAPGDGAVRERITREAAGRAEDCVPPWEPCGTPAAGDPATGDLAHHSVRLLWEVMTGPGRWTRLTSGSSPSCPRRWRPVRSPVIPASSPGCGSAWCAAPTMPRPSCAASRSTRPRPSRPSRRSSGCGPRRAHRSPAPRRPPAKRPAWTCRSTGTGT